MKTGITRSLIFSLILTTISCWLMGCLLKPGGNDSLSSLSSISIGDTSAQYQELFKNATIYSGNSVASGVAFSHFTHVSVSKKACSECHPDLFSMGSGTVNAGIVTGIAAKSLKMADLYQGKYCGKCHNGAGTFNVKTECSRCHSNLSSNGPEVTMVLAVAGDVGFSHKSHVDSYKMTCDRCHQDEKPWPMKNRVGLHTMDQMYAKDSCGKCHSGAAGAGFDINDSKNCAKCHIANFHSKVNTSYIGSEACILCHKEIVAEFQVPNSGNLAHGLDFISGHNSANNAACGECHHHEAINGKTAAVAVPPLSNHNISCQTCHAVENTGQAGLLRKPAKDLCANCHHARYLYVPSFPTLPSYNASDSNAWPIDLRGFGFNGDARLIASTTNAAKIEAGLASFTKFYLSIQKDGKIHGGNYPHDSTQWDLVQGSSARATFEFTKDISGKSLSYSDSNIKVNSNNCVECHMVKNSTIGSKSFGHTFQAPANGESCKKFYTEAGFNLTIYQENIKSLMTQIKPYLDSDKNGTITWTRNGADQDLVVAMNDTTLASGTKVILLGAAWNYFFIEGDRSEGIHNYLYAKNLLENTLTVLKQINVPWL